MEQSNLLRRLTKKVSDNLPCGEDLRNTDPFYEVIAKCKSTKDFIYQQAVRRESNLHVSEAAQCSSDLEKLLKQTKDIQLVVWLTYNLSITKGVYGLRVGLSLLDYLVNNMWDHFHPRSPQERGYIFSWLDTQINIDFCSTTLILEHVRMYHIEGYNYEQIFELIRSLQINEPTVKQVEKELGKCFKACDSIEQGFNSKQKEERISLEGLRYALGTIGNRVASMVKACNALNTNTTSSQKEENDEQENKETANSVKSIVLREKIYDELWELANNLLRVNRKDIIALVLMDAIKKLRNREVIDILQFLIEDPVYLKYIQKLINEAEH